MVQCEFVLQAGKYHKKNRMNTDAILHTTSDLTFCKTKVMRKVSALVFLTKLLFNSADVWGKREALGVDSGAAQYTCTTGGWSVGEEEWETSSVVNAETEEIGHAQGPEKLTYTFIIHSLCLAVFSPFVFTVQCLYMYVFFSLGVFYSIKRSHS